MSTNAKFDPNQAVTAAKAVENVAKPEDLKESTKTTRKRSRSKAAVFGIIVAVVALTSSIAYAVVQLNARVMGDTPEEAAITQNENTFMNYVEAGDGSGYKPGDGYVGVKYAYEGMIDENRKPVHTLDVEKDLPFKNATTTGSGVNVDGPARTELADAIIASNNGNRMIFASGVRYPELPENGMPIAVWGDQAQTYSGVYLYVGPDISPEEFHGYPKDITFYADDKVLGTVSLPELSKLQWVQVPFETPVKGLTLTMHIRTIHKGNLDELDIPSKTTTAFQMFQVVPY